MELRSEDVCLGKHCVEVPQHVSSDLLEHLTMALLRGVDVYILLSNKNWWNHWTAETTTEAVRAYFVENAKSLSKRQKASTPVPSSEAAMNELLCNRLHVAAMRDGVGELATNHSKVVVADDAAFYMGSQNLYPGGLADTVITQLAEFGYIVDDATATEALVGSLWEPAWRAAVGNAVSGSESESACVLRASE
jgi:phosphatidylserine/phosphatidylglycerophosphate/cardiolipin synthase-like enzyme